MGDPPADMTLSRANIALAVVLLVLVMVDASVHKVSFDRSEGKELHNKTVTVALDDKVEATFFGLLTTVDAPLPRVSLIRPNRRATTG